MHLICIIKKMIPTVIKDNIKIINYKRKYHYKHSKVKNSKCVILFLVSRTNIFSSVESVYTEANKNKCIDTYLIALPDRSKNKKNTDNSNVLDFCKGIAGDRAISCYENDGSFVDLRKFNPDYIFLGIPYNEEYPDGFKFHEMANFSKLCVVPYGYCFIDGVVLETAFNLCLLAHISYFFAEGPIGYRYCKKKLFLFEKLEGVKVYSLGFPRFDLLKSKNDCLEKKKIKRIAYFPRWTTPENEANGHEPSSFMLFKDRILDFAEKHSDYEIVIRPHPILFDRFIKYGLLNKEEIKEYMDIISSTNNVTLDESNDYHHTLISADIVVTDYSSTIAEFLLVGQPIIYFGTSQNFSEQYKPLFNGMYNVNNWESVEDLILDISRGNDYKKNYRITYTQKILRQNIKSAGELIINRLLKDWKDS